MCADEFARRGHDLIGVFRAGGIGPVYGVGEGRGGRELGKDDVAMRIRQHG